MLLVFDVARPHLNHADLRGPMICMRRSVHESCHSVTSAFGRPRLPARATRGRCNTSAGDGDAPRWRTAVQPHRQGSPRSAVQTRPAANSSTRCAPGGDRGRSENELRPVLVLEPNEHPFDYQPLRQDHETDTFASAAMEFFRSFSGFAWRNNAVYLAPLSSKARNSTV
jgi:hypothetical protein